MLRELCEGWQLKLREKTLDLDDRCKIARFIWSQKSCKTKDKQVIFEWLIGTLTAYEKSCGDPSCKALWILLQDVLQISAKHYELDSWYAIPPDFLKVVPSVVDAINKNTQSTSEILKTFISLFTAGQLTNILTSSYTVMSTLVVCGVKLVLQKLNTASSTHLEPCLLQYLDTALSTITVAQRQQINTKTVFTVTVKQLLEPAINLLHQVHHASHLTTDTVSKLQHAANGLLDVVHNSLLHSEMYKYYELTLGLSVTNADGINQKNLSKMSGFVEVLYDALRKPFMCPETDKPPVSHTALLWYLPRFYSAFLSHYSYEHAQYAGFVLLKQLCAWCLHIDFSDVHNTKNPAKRRKVTAKNTALFCANSDAQLRCLHGLLLHIQHAETSSEEVIANVHSDSGINGDMETSELLDDTNSSVQKNNSKRKRQASGAPSDHSSQAEWCKKLVTWLLVQQYRGEHFYGCLCALKNFDHKLITSDIIAALKNTWLVSTEQTTDANEQDRDAYLVSLIELYSELRMIPELIDSMLRVIRLHPNDLVCARELWPTLMQQALQKVFRDFPQALSIKVWSRLVSEIKEEYCPVTEGDHKSGSDSDVNDSDDDSVVSVECISVITHLLALLTCNVCAVDQHITVDTKRTIHNLITDATHHIVPKLVKHHIRASPEQGIHYILELCLGCLCVSRCLDEYSVTGDTNSMKLSNSDTASASSKLHTVLHMVNSYLKPEVWEQLLSMLTDSHTACVMFDFVLHTMLTLLQADKTPESTHTPAVCVCRDWLYEQCMKLLDTHAHKQANSIEQKTTAQYTHTPQLGLFINHAVILTDMWGTQKLQQLISKLIVLPQYHQKSHSVAGAVHISAVLSSALVIPIELPVVQEAIIYAVLDATLQLVKRHNSGTDKVLHRTVVSVAQCIIELCSQERKVEEEDRELFCSILTHQQDLTLRHERDADVLHQLCKELCMLPVQYLPVHTSRCAQLYILYMLALLSSHSNDSVQSRTYTSSVHHQLLLALMKLIDTKGSSYNVLLDLPCGTLLQFVCHHPALTDDVTLKKEFISQVFLCSMKACEENNDEMWRLNELCAFVKKEAKLLKKQPEKITAEHTERVQNASILVQVFSKVLLRKSTASSLYTTLRQAMHDMIHVYTKHLDDASLHTIHTCTQSPALYSCAMSGFCALIHYTPLRDNVTKYLPRCIDTAGTVLESTKITSPLAVHAAVSLVTHVCINWSSVCESSVPSSILCTLWSVLHKRLITCTDTTGLHMSEVTDEVKTEDNDVDGSDAVDTHTHATVQHTPRTMNLLTRALSCLLRCSTADLYMTIVQQVMANVDVLDVNSNRDKLMASITIWRVLVKTTVRNQDPQIMQIAAQCVIRKLYKIPDVLKRNRNPASFTQADIDLLLLVLHTVRDMAALGDRKLLVSTDTTDALCCTQYTYTHRLSTVLFVPLYTAAIQLCNDLLVHRSAAVYNAIPDYMNSCRSLLVGLVHHSDQSRCTSDNITQLRDCADLMRRLCNLIISHKEDFSKEVHHFISDYIYNVSKVTLHPDIKDRLTQCMYAMLSVCDNHTVAQMFMVLPTGLSYVFRTLHEDYKKYYKYKGNM